jgi:hypothetical protein
LPGASHKEPANELERRLRYVGERNEAEAIGEPPAIERALGFDWTIEQPSPPPDQAAAPDEEAVMQVAAAWSIDPASSPTFPPPRTPASPATSRMAETEGPQGREGLFERIDRVVASLSQPLSRAERKAGWSPEAAMALPEHFEHVRDRLCASGASIRAPFQPATKPGAAWTHGGSTSRVTARSCGKFSTSHELRRPSGTGDHQLPTAAAEGGGQSPGDQTRLRLVRRRRRPDEPFTSLVTRRAGGS